MNSSEVLIPELSVVMPAYNEEAVLPHSLAEAAAALDRLCERWELVMVDDGSTDATPSILAEAARRDPRIRIVTHPANLGYSAALAHGFAACRYEAIFYTDSDAQFDFEDLRRAWPLLAEADMVAGWRRDRQDSRLRCLASQVFNLLQSVVLGVRARDVDCAFKLFRRSYFEQVRLSSEGFLIDAELYARASQAGLRVEQLPVTHRARPGGHSSVRPATVGTTLLHLWRLSGDLRRGAPAGEAGPGMRWQTHLPVFLLALVLGLAFQGSRGLWEPDEGRNVNIGLGMLQTSDWLIPRLSGEPYLDKPPFHYWTIAAGMALLGHNEWGARAGQALLFALTALLVGALGKRLWNDPDTGRLAALIYATSLAPFAATNVLTPDTPLAACTVLLAYAWWRAETAAGHGPRFGWWLLTGAAAGLGALAKGPAILIFAAPLGLWMLLRGRMVAALREPGVWAGTAVSLLIALSWYGPVVHSLPGAGAYLLDNQVMGRLFTETYQRNPGWQGAVESYLPILLFGLFPWSLWWLARGRSLLSSRLRSLPRFFRWSSPGQLLVLWIVCPLLVLLSASSRLPLYVLPLFAPAALATARGLASWQAAQGVSHRARRLAFASLAVWCLALLALKGFAAQWEGGRDTRRYARWLATEAAGDPSAVIAVKVPLYGLPLYGFTDVRSVVLEGEGYPMFTPQRTLTAAVPELAAGTPTPLVVVQEEKAQDARTLLKNAGLSCRLRPPHHRLALLICDQIPGLARP